MPAQWNPESTAQLQMRYLASVTGVYDRHAIVSGALKRPGTQPQHVFDWEDGLRLIVSRDRFPDGRTGVAVSGSLAPGSQLFRHLQEGAEFEEAFCGAVSARWRVLAKSRRVPEFLGWSQDKGVPHFVVWDES